MFRSIPRRLLSSSQTQNKIPFRVCIVGSGPAGLYVAQKIVKRSHETPGLLGRALEVDILEKLPTPYGLVRYGVAPDHSDVKHCTEGFSEWLQSQSPTVEWIGGVSLGEDVTLQELCVEYHAVVLAVGAQKQRHLGIPGENLRHVLSSYEWTGWVNGYPNGPSLTLDPHVEQAVILGNGNVALDVARLLLSPSSVLHKTDMCAEAIASLESSSIRNVRIVGRRGPAQVSFTTKELRELFRLCREWGINVSVFPPLEETHLSDPALILDRSHRRVFELILTELKTERFGTSGKSLSFFFLLSPICFHPLSLVPDSVGAIEFSHTRLVKDSDSRISPIHWKTEPVPDLPFYLMEADLVVKCLGYEIAPIPGLPDGMQSQRDGRIAHSGGRVESVSQASLLGLFVAGWCKRGASGVLASTMMDAFETAETVLADASLLITEKQTGSVHGRSWLLRTLTKRKTSFFLFADWLRVDAAERTRGEAVQKPREKLTRLSDFNPFIRR